MYEQFLEKSESGGGLSNAGANLPIFLLTACAWPFLYAGSVQYWLGHVQKELTYSQTAAVAVILLLTATYPIIFGAAISFGARITGFARRLMYYIIIICQSIITLIITVMEMIHPEVAFDASSKLQDSLWVILGAMFALLNMFSFAAGMLCILTTVRRNLSKKLSLRNNMISGRLNVQEQVRRESGEWTSGCKNPLQVQTLQHHGFTAFQIIIVIIVPLFCSMILPPGWERVAGNTFMSYAKSTTDAIYTFLDPLATITLAGTKMFVKLYVDVCIYFMSLFLVILIGAIGTYNLQIRRWLSTRIIVNKNFPLASHRVVSYGELILSVAITGLYGYWAFYWGVKYQRIQDDAFHKYAEPRPVLHVAARAMGHMATLSFGLALLPLTRNSLWDSVFSVPFERAIKFHRYLGVVSYTAVTLHLLLWTVLWGMDGVPILQNLFASTGTPNVMQVSKLKGHANNFVTPLVTVAWLTMSVAVMLAIFRRRIPYDLFLSSHYSLYFVLLVAELHAWSHWYHTIGALALFALDKVFRAHNSSTGYEYRAKVVGDVVIVQTDISVVHECAPQPGAYVFVCIPDVSSYSWHPFTIANTERFIDLADNEKSKSTYRLTLCIRNRGEKTWTGKLHSLISTSGLEINTENHMIQIDGFYGALPVTPDVERLILVSGGIGVTPMHALLKTIYKWDYEAARFRSPPLCDFIWTVKNASLLGLFANTIFEIMMSSREDVKIRFHLFVTGKHDDDDDVNVHDALREAIDEGVCTEAAADLITKAVMHGRPDLESLIADGPEDRSRTGLLVCGPEKLAEHCGKLFVKMDLGFFHGEEFHL